MTRLMGKLITTLLVIITCCFSVTLSSAQGDAIIVGKVDNPQSRVVRFEYKRNHFSLEEGSFEANLDTNNVFSVRVNLNESRALFCTYRENAVKIFVSPGDTLKMRFSGEKMLESLVFDGNAAHHNDYLLKTQKKFPDWLNESSLVKARLDKSSRDYLTFVDSIFTEKRSFFDRFPADQKANFTNDFLEFATNDINYWRAYELMLYVKTYTLNNTDPMRLIDDTYFNFTLETDNVYFKALNNEYYLQYLELYLSYMSEKGGMGRKDPVEIVEERSRYIKTVKPKGRNLRVIEEPYLPKDVVSWLAPNEEAVYQNLLTGEKFKYVGEDSTYEDIFLKIKTSDGKTGWVPQSAIAIYEKTIIERTVHNRFCFQPEEPLCGFDKQLSGKVLYYTVAKDILYSLVYDKFEVIDVRIKNFIERNIDHREYNDVIREAYKLAARDRQKGINQLNIPHSCDVEEYWKDRIFYAHNLRQLPSDNLDFPDKVVVNYGIPKSNNPQKNDETPIKPKVVADPATPSVTTVTTNTSTKTEVVKVETPAQPTEKVAAKTETPAQPTEKVAAKTETPAQPTEKIANKTETPAPQTREIKIAAKPTESIPAKTADNPVTKVDDATKTQTDNNAKAPEPTKPNTQIANSEVKPEDKPEVKSETKTNYNSSQPIKFAVGDEKLKIQFDTENGFMPLGDYVPTGKPLIFKGMVINEDITPFEFKDIDNNPVRQQDLLGKVIVLNFWATWCGPCKPTLEYTQRLAAKYSNKDVVFIYVSADSDMPTWKEFLKEHPMKGIQGMDANMLLRINLRVQGVPNYFIIDKTGHVAYNSVIRSTYSAEEMIEMLLKSP